MKNLLFLLFALSFSLYSCTSSTIKDTTGKDTTNSVSKPIRIEIPYGSSSITVKGRINGINDKQTFIFAGKMGQVLNVKLIPSIDTANIRINQIITPNGESDGPFGRELNNYGLGTNGDYQLIIGESLMQGDSWKGEFTLEIDIR